MEYVSFVNLDHRTDRHDHMRSELTRVGVTAIRQRGIPWKETDYTNPKYAVMYNRTPGAIGCHLSQVEIIKKAFEIGADAMVFEDDIIFCDDFHERLQYIGKWMESNEWDVFWLGAAMHVNPPHWHKHGGSMMRPNCSAELGYDAKRTDDPRIIRTYGAYNTFAYMVNYKSIPKVLALLDKHVHESIGIDWLFIKLQPQLNCFTFVPGCIYQKDNMSDIGSGMTMWSGHLKNGPYVWQRLMTDFEPENYNWHECK